jgi:hypothetical protein
LVAAQDIDEDRDEYLCVFYHCLNELEHSANDLFLREYASQCLHRFLQRRPTHLGHRLTKIRLILKHPNSSSTVRQAFLRHLASLIDLNVDHGDLLGLKRLRHPTDLNLDFFENIYHVQNHRRLRALKRLKTIHEEHIFRSTAIDHYLLSIVCSFINERTQDIHDDIVFQCLDDLSQRLPSRKQSRLFIFFVVHSTKITLKKEHRHMEMTFLIVFTLDRGSTRPSLICVHWIEPWKDLLIVEDEISGENEEEESATKLCPQTDVDLFQIDCVERRSSNERKTHESSEDD